jgi:hypothetical protein
MVLIFGKLMAIVIVVLVAVGLLVTYTQTMTTGNYIVNAGIIQGGLVAIIPPVLIIGGSVVLIWGIIKSFKKRG